MSWLVYVYAVVAAPVAGDLDGIDRAPLRWVSEGDLTAAVSDVPAQDFEERALNQAIRDMSWLGPRAIAHQQVNERLHERSSAVVPLAFGTVFRDDQRVRSLLREQADLLRERLQAVSGRSEWVVAMHRVGQADAAAVRPHSPALRALEAEIDGAGPGRAHLLRQRLAQLERQETRRLDDVAAEDVLQALASVADAAYAEPLPAESVERPLLRASLLVRRASEEAFLGAIERLRARWPAPHYQVQVTGPWPPYRFGGLRQQETGAGTRG